jgi:putative acetyltransferase
MMRELVIRPAEAGDREAIFALEAAAFGQDGEAKLVEALVADGDVVLELVATHEAEIVGHILFSRLKVETGQGTAHAVALAPLAVHPERQNTKVGTALIENGHRLLQEAGETLSVVLGDPAYYGRFGYAHARAARFDSDYQCDALQALSWGQAPVSGRLIYSKAFGGL